MRPVTAFNWPTPLALVGLLLSGCTSVSWVRPGTDEAQVRRDLSGCEVVAAGRYQQQQPQQQVASAAATEPEQRDDEAASYSIALDTEAITRNLERQAEIDRLVRECMLALGYEPVVDD